MVQSTVKVKKVTIRLTVSQSISMSWCLVHAALEGLHPKEFEFDIRRSAFEYNLSCLKYLGTDHIEITFGLLQYNGFLAVVCVPSLLGQASAWTEQKALLPFYRIRALPCNGRWIAANFAIVGLERIYLAQ
jgi:hypothetical protein